MTRLSVNLNKIALLRNARSIGIPSVIESAKTVIKAGANGITVHPRPDERHIRYSDVYELAEMMTVEYNIEGNPFTGRFMELMRDVKPDQATLVPDEPGANTSDHGWNLKKDGKKLVPIIKELKALGIRVSLFMDPEPAGIIMAGQLDADRVELYTEPYAAAFVKNENLDEMLERYVKAAKTATDTGLGLNAGHDLNLKNLGKFCKTVPGILEVSIGHALIADSLEMGLYNTVKEYLKVLNKLGV
jgi:pyridoxine 5-phosphate synthase